MIQSMTGFSIKSMTIMGYEIKVEIKSVNSRYLDIHIKSNKVNLLQEKIIRDMIKKYLKRGRVDFYYTLKKEKGELPAINKEVLSYYSKRLSEISEELSIKNFSNISEIINLPGIFTFEENEEEIEEVFQKSLNVIEDAILDLVKMRKKEGKNLYDFIIERIFFVEESILRIEKESSKIFDIQFNKIRSRMEKLITDIKIDEKVILEISALAADKFDISEEIERFKSHIEQFRNTLNENVSVGKKLDFIVQEMNREINTMLSKSDTKEIKKIGLDIKTEIEKIREQVQNIE